MAARAKTKESESRSRFFAAGFFGGRILPKQAAPCLVFLHQNVADGAAM
jgi:hypothetical protein